MRLEHHLVGGYVRYISPHIIIIKYFLTIDDLCNGAKMVNLPLVVVEI